LQLVILPLHLLFK